MADQPLRDDEELPQEEDFGDEEDFIEKLEELDLDLPDCEQKWQSEFQECITCIALSPKKTALCVATADDEFYVVDTATGEIKFTLPGHKGGTNAVAFISGSMLASCGEDGKLKLWSLAKLECIADFDIKGSNADKSSFGQSVNYLCVAPDGKLIAVASGKTVVGCFLDNGIANPRIKNYNDLPSTIEALRFDTNGNILAAYNGGVTLWDMSRAEDDLQMLDMPYSGACLSVDAAQNTKWVVAGCHDATVHINQLTIVEGRDGGLNLEQLTCSGYESKVKLVDFNPAQNLLASSGGSGCIIWDFTTSPAGQMPLLAISNHTGITCQTWLSNDIVLTSAKDGRTCVFNARKIAKAPNFVAALAATDFSDDEVTELACIQEQAVFFTGSVSGILRCHTIPADVLAGSS